MRAADVVISNAVDLTYEEELREIPDILEERKTPFARNMATTASLLSSNWGLTPYELVSEIRIQANALAKPGAKWVMTHPNGSHIEGYVVKPEDMDDYAHYRDIGVYCPFPEGVWSSIRARDAEGVGIINEVGVIWARHIGVPCPFKQPVKVFIEKGYIKKFEGGAEAETLTRFYQFLSKYLGEAAYVAFKGPRRVVPLFSSDGDRTRVLGEAQQRLVDTVDAVARGDFPPAPDDVWRCETCSFSPVCRKDYVGDV